MEYKFKKLHLSSVKERRTSRVGEWTHSDIFGCACEDLYFGARYAVCFVDDFSKYVMVLPMLNRTTASLRRAFCVYVSRMAVFGHIVAGLQYDGAQEYVSAEHSDFLDELAVEHIATCRYRSAQNGTAEAVWGVHFPRVRTALSLAMGELTPYTKRFWLLYLMYSANVVSELAC